MKRLLLAAALALLAAPAMAQLVEPNGTYAGPPIVPEASCRKPDCFFPVWKNLFPDDGSVDQGALWQAAMGSSSSPATTIPLGAPTMAQPAPSDWSGPVFSGPALISGPTAPNMTLPASSPPTSLTLMPSASCSVTVYPNGTVKRAGCKDMDDAARTFWKAVELVGMKLACVVKKP